MKLTYQFMQDLLNLLRMEDFRVDLNQRIEEIDQKLETLSLSTEEKISQRIHKWEGLKAQKRNFPTIEQQKGTINSIELDSYIHRETLIQKKEALEASLKDNRYNLASGAFEDPENVKLLLQHMNFLYSKDLGFNLSSVRIVESMLKENFSKLHDQKVDKGIADWIIVHNDFSMIEELLLGKINNSEDLKEFYIRQGALDIRIAQDPLFEKFILNLYNVLTIPNIELISHSYEKLKPFIIWFNTKMIYRDWDHTILTLSAYFSSKEAIDNYLEQEVNFESFETIENTIIISWPKISELTNEELSIWHNLNAQYGKESIKLFAHSSNIKNKGFNIIEVAVGSENLNDLFQKVQAFIQNIKFTREEGHENLANILHKYNIEEESFNKILDEVLPNIQNSNLLPGITITTQDDKYTLRKLSPTEYIGFVLGKITACCQYIGGDSEKCVIDGFTRNTAGFYVLENKEGKIKAQCYAWIGLNDQGKDVLILDSFEHLTEAKKYFIELIQKLSVKIGNEGFAGLYVGTGGKTPQLNATKVAIAAKDPDLHRYRDSELVYQVTKDTKILNKDESYKFKYKTFDDIINDPHYSVLSYIQSIDPEISANLNRKSMALITSSTDKISKWLAKGLITPEQIVKLFAVDNPFARNDDNYYLPYCNDQVLVQVAESINNISNFLELRALIQNKQEDYDRNMVNDILNDLVWQIELKVQAEEQKALDTAFNIQNTLNIFDYSNNDNNYKLAQNIQKEILDGKISPHLQDLCNEPKITKLIGQFEYGDCYCNSYS